jgi:uncharacterized membrane protein (DUF2068 family)
MRLGKCARSGHITYRPVHTLIVNKLKANTPEGDAWKCLRCDTYVVGSPTFVGEVWPEVIRGKAFRELFIIRLFAVERILRAKILLIASIALLKYHSIYKGFNEIIGKHIPFLKSLYNNISLQVDKTWLVQNLAKFSNDRLHNLNILIFLLMIFSLVSFIEAIGLWWNKRWGAYMASIVCFSSVLLIANDIVHSATLLKIVAILIDILLMALLIWNKRLFRVRGGKKALKKNREREIARYLESI